MAKNLAGLHAALPTPFAHDRVDGDGIGRLVQRTAAQGLDGIYVAGSTGEGFLMSEAERLHVLEAAYEGAQGLTTIAHVGDVNPAVSHRLAREAARIGYDAISAVPPFYYGYRFEEIRAHYATLASATDLPFLVYNFPALSGVKMSADQLGQLLALPNVVGVKNTCPDHYALERLRQAVPGATLLNGFDETLLAGLALGCDGGIGSTYNIQGARITAIAGAAQTGRMDEARALQARANGVIDVLVAHGVLPGLKHLLTRLGLPMGVCRPPFAPLSPEGVAALDRLLEDGALEESQAEAAE